MSNPQRRDALLAAAEVLANTQRLLVLTGAGLSADAGVPTFRDHGGLWRQFRPEELASSAGFQYDPEAVWDWYRERRLHIARCQPHAGQRAIALLQHHAEQKGRHVLVATTNEDDLLERAGVHRPVCLHGQLFVTRCAAGCGWQALDDADNGLSLLPCPRCGAAVRPGSVWFGEPVPERELSAVDDFKPTACMVVGSSSLVRPVSEIPMELAFANVPVIEVNSAETPISRHARAFLQGPAARVLPKLVDLATSATVRTQMRNRGSETQATRAVPSADSASADAGPDPAEGGRTA